jgi:hypothetical protein
VTSDRRIEANRRNAAKSTGPRTAAGKAVVARNATRHGVLSTRLLVHDEKRADLLALAERLRAELRPVGELEEQLVERMVACLWRLRRVAHAEAALINNHHNEQFPAVEQKFSRYMNWEMSKLSRYEAQIERSLYKALQELERRQAARAVDTAPVPPILDGEAEAIEPGEDS